MREWMIKLREEKGLAVREMAMACGISMKLLAILEDLDGITHPNIATNIAVMYGMSVAQRNELCASDHHVQTLALPQKRPERKADGNAPEPLVRINAKCVYALIENLHKDTGDISERMLHGRNWLDAVLARGTMKPSAIRRLAKILDVKPDQIRASGT